MTADTTLGGDVSDLTRGDGAGLFYREGSHGVFKVNYVLDLFYTGGAP